MGQKKLIRFAEIETFPNVLQYPQHMKGQWRTFFKNEHPLTLELACGKGEYAVGLGRMYPQRNFIGIDLKGNRIWVGAKTAIKENLGNVAFVRSQIDQVNNYFAADEVREIWITFPDPRPRDRDEKHRLTGPRFLEMYRQLLAPGGTVHLKTDSLSLFEYTLEVLRTQSVNELYYTHDLYRSEFNDLHHGIKTRYEALFTAKGYDINYLQFKFIE